MIMSKNLSVSKNGIAVPFWTFQTDVGHTMQPTNMTFLSVTLLCVTVANV